MAANGGYGWLQVKCHRCETEASIPLDAVRRPRGTRRACRRVSRPRSTKKARAVELLIPAFRTQRDVSVYFTAGASFFRFLSAAGLGLVCVRLASPRSRFINLRDLSRSSFRHSASSSRFLAIRAAARWFSRLRWQTLHLFECEPFVLAGFVQSTQINRYSRIMVDSMDSGRAAHRKRPLYPDNDGPSPVLAPHKAVRTLHDNDTGPAKCDIVDFSRSKANREVKCTNQFQCSRLSRSLHCFAFSFSALDLFVRTYLSSGKHPGVRVIAPIKVNSLEW
jgi:hypothetical protein